VRVADGRGDERFPNHVFPHIRHRIHSFIRFKATPILTSPPTTPSNAFTIPLIYPKPLTRESEKPVTFLPPSHPYALRPPPNLHLHLFLYWVETVYMYVYILSYMTTLNVISVSVSERRVVLGKNPNEEGGELLKRSGGWMNCPKEITKPANPKWTESTVPVCVYTYNHMRKRERSVEESEMKWSKSGIYWDRASQFYLIMHVCIPFYFYPVRASFRICKPTLHL